MSEITNRPAVAAELLADSCGVLQTIKSCRQVIALCRVADMQSGMDGADMGLFRVLGLVSDALAHIEGEVRVLMKLPLEEGKEPG